LPKMPTGVIP